MEKIKRILSIILYGYLSFIAVWCVFYFTPLEITNKVLKQIIYETVIYGIIPATLITTIRIWMNRNLDKKLKLVSSICIIIFPFLLNWVLPRFGIVSVFWNSHSIWQDVEVIAYKSENDQIIEQRIDSGAFGFNKRIVREIKLTSFLSWSRDYYGKDLNELQKEGWTIESNRSLEIGG